MKVEHLENFFNTTELSNKNLLGGYVGTVFLYLFALLLYIIEPTFNIWFYLASGVMIAATVFLIVAAFFRRTAAKCDLVDGVAMIEWALLLLLIVSKFLYKQEYLLYGIAIHFFLWIAFSVFAYWSMIKNIQENRYSSENSKHQLRTKNNQIFFVKTKRFTVAFIVFILLVSVELIAGLYGAPFFTEISVVPLISSVLLLLCVSMTFFGHRMLLRVILWKKYGIQSD